MTYVQVNYRDKEVRDEEVGDALGPAPSMPMGRDLALLLGANSYGNPSQDPGVLAVRYVHGASINHSIKTAFTTSSIQTDHRYIVSFRRFSQSHYPGGHVGIFPWFSFLNHSCSPNTSYLVMGDAMVVRAAADTATGEQLTITYIGPRVLEPLEQRRSYLQVWIGSIFSRYE